MKITLKMLESAGACTSVLEVWPEDGREIARESVAEMAREHPEWLVWGVGCLPVEVSSELLAAGADVHARDEYGQTALILAAGNGHTATVERLLAAGADVNARDQNGQTALMFAEGRGHTEMVERLLAAGADVNARDRNGRTALMLAAWRRQPETVKPNADAGH